MFFKKRNDESARFKRIVKTITMDGEDAIVINKNTHVIEYSNKSAIKNGFQFGMNMTEFSWYAKLKLGEPCITDIEVGGGTDSITYDYYKSLDKNVMLIKWKQ